jgi:hypothetical protein
MDFFLQFLFQCHQNYFGRYFGHLTHFLGNRRLFSRDIEISKTKTKPQNTHFGAKMTKNQNFFFQIVLPFVVFRGLK